MLGKVLKPFRGFLVKGSSHLSPHCLCLYTVNHDPFCNPSFPAGFSLREYVVSIIFLAVHYVCNFSLRLVLKILAWHLSQTPFSLLVNRIVLKVISLFLWKDLHWEDVPASRSCSVSMHFVGWSWDQGFKTPFQTFLCVRYSGCGSDGEGFLWALKDFGLSTLQAAVLLALFNPSWSVPGKSFSHIKGNGLW